MILVGNQRGGGRELAVHLLKEENDHVTIHEVRGFSSLTLRDAFNEAHALSKGTRCRQYLFSLSLNPPESANVPTLEFEAAIERIEERLGLSGQPRVVVFHEKQGRRHAHCVWSRIRASDMKAVQLSFTHTALMDIARDLYIEHGWKMPDGLAKSKARDPRNFTLAEWQQARRQDKDPRSIKTALQDAWAISDTGTAFGRALEERGYKLARGDRRGFVAVDTSGEVYSLSRWLNLKTNALRARLGSEEQLCSISEAKGQFAEELKPVVMQLQTNLLRDVSRKNRELRAQSMNAVKRQRQIRQELLEKQERRQREEARERQSRFRSGLQGFWDFVRGENKRIRQLNEAKATAARIRDRNELDALIFAQLEERRRIADLRSQIAREFAVRHSGLRGDLRVYDDFRIAASVPPVRRRNLDR